MNTLKGEEKYQEAARVQIPLWSMNTHLIGANHQNILCSDSSMVDEYNNPCTNLQLFLTRSDSSMVDEYPAKRGPLSRIMEVQIPLWSMNTPDLILGASSPDRFRFLYGR